MNEVKVYYVDMGFAKDEPYKNTILQKHDKQMVLHSDYLAEKNRADEAEKIIKVADEKNFPIYEQLCLERSFIAAEQHNYLEESFELKSKIKVLEDRLDKAIGQRDELIKDAVGFIKGEETSETINAFAAIAIPMDNEIYSITELTVKERE